MSVDTPPEKIRMRTRPTYTPEFDAVDLLARTDRSLNMVARDLGIASTTLRSWYLTAEVARKKPKEPPATATPTEAVERESAKEQIHLLLDPYNLPIFLCILFLLFADRARSL